MLTLHRFRVTFPSVVKCHCTVGHCSEVQRTQGHGGTVATAAVSLFYCRKEQPNEQTQ